MGHLPFCILVVGNPVKNTVIMTKFMGLKHPQGKLNSSFLWIIRINVQCSDFYTWFSYYNLILLTHIVVKINHSAAMSDHEDCLD